MQPRAILDVNMTFVVMHTHTTTKPKQKSLTAQCDFIFFLPLSDTSTRDTLNRCTHINVFPQVQLFKVCTFIHSFTHSTELQRMDSALLTTQDPVCMPSETPQKIKPNRMTVIRQLQLLNAPQSMEEEFLSGNPKSHHHIFEPISQFTHYDTSLEGQQGGHCRR